MSQNREMEEAWQQYVSGLPKDMYVNFYLFRAGWLAAHRSRNETMLLTPRETEQVENDLDRRAQVIPELLALRKERERAAFAELLEIEGEDD